MRSALLDVIVYALTSIDVREDTNIGQDTVLLGGVHDALNEPVRAVRSARCRRHLATSSARARIAALSPAEVRHVPIESARPGDKIIEEHGARRRDAAQTGSKIRQPRERARRGARQVSVRAANEVLKDIVQVSTEHHTRG
jgi:hypothetical protein